VDLRIEADVYRRLNTVSRNTVQSVHIQLTKYPYTPI